MNPIYFNISYIVPTTLIVKKLDLFMKIVELIEVKNYL